MLERRRGLTIAIAIALAAPAAASGLVDGLATDDPHVLDAGVAAIEHTSAADADELFAAGRACEDRLADPPRALALYERVLREHPDASAAFAAARRVAVLRTEVGEHAEHAAEAREQALLIANADRWPADELVRRADALSDARWPGAADSAVWLAEWLRRARRFDDAQARYALVLARWPGSPAAVLAARGAAGCAIDAHDWNLAETLAARLSTADPVDAAVRDDILAAARRGRRHTWLYSAAWLALALSIAALAGSLADAIVRGGRRWPSPRPPIELLFLGPIAVVFAVVAFTAHPAIAPAVLRISIVGVVLAWLSGAALDLLRARDRPVRARAAGHVLACLLGVASIAYIALVRDGLLDVLAETVRFGPGS